MKKVVTKTTLTSQSNDLAYRLSRPAAERVAAVELLRQQADGYAEQRLQRVFKLTQFNQEFSS